jgi:hypothetical protein
MKNKLKIMLTGALLLAAATTLAGIIFVPVGGRYINPELAPVDIQSSGNGLIRIRTTDLNGMLNPDCSDVAECQSFDIGCAEIPFTEQIDLTIDRQSGDIEGRIRGRINTQPNYEFVAKIRGDATCLPSGGHTCGQIVMDLESRGVLTDRADPTGVATLRVQILGSLLRSGSAASWATLSSRGTFGFALPDDVAEIFCNAN